jgi:hypothetical protein
MNNAEHHADRIRRAPIATRISPADLAVIERVAEQRRTTPAQVTRCLIEDGVKALAAGAAA